jgi:ribonucleotide reductase beta subunit family protein with ferritin-like domain
MDANRKALFPILHEDLWRSYKQACECDWKVEKVDLSHDRHDWDNKLTAGERHFLTHVLAFFVNADMIVNDNLAKHMRQLVPQVEAQFFYDQQMYIENIHTEMYALLVQVLISDEQERDRVFNSIETIPSVRAKAQWARTWIDNPDATLAERLVAFAIVEGVFFSGSFAAIFYIKQRGILPGLTQSNEYISRDEGLHTKFACLYYKNYVPDDQKLDRDRMLDIFESAVRSEQEFFTDALPVSLLGMNARAMCDYIEYVADRLLVDLEQERHYNKANPFTFMNNISLEGKTNFFEKKSTEYKMYGAGVNETYEILTDF